jgi:hypothetical protein
LKQLFLSFALPFHLFKIAPDEEIAALREKLKEDRTSTQVLNTLVKYAGIQESLSS